MRRSSMMDLGFLLLGGSKILRRTNQERPEANDLSQTQSSQLRPLLPSLSLSSQLSLPTLLPSLSSPLFGFIMASSKSVMRLVASGRPTLSSSSLRPLGSTANFSSSVRRAALPAGPPQPGFRLSPPKRWDQSEESSLDKATKYFLMSEIFRGMYVVLEQFFRPP